MNEFNFCLKGVRWSLTATVPDLIRIEMRSVACLGFCGASSCTFWKESIFSPAKGPSQMITLIHEECWWFGRPRTVPATSADSLKPNPVVEEQEQRKGPKSMDLRAEAEIEKANLLHQLMVLHSTACMCHVRIYDCIFWKDRPLNSLGLAVEQRLTSVDWILQLTASRGTVV